MWGDDRFQDLSKPQPNAQSLWQYLLTGPHKTVLPCAFIGGEAGLAEAIGWTLSGFRKAFKEVLDKGMVRVDWSKRLIFIPNALKHNHPENPNVVKAWRKAFNELPDCPLKVEIFAHIKAFLLKEFSEVFQKAFGEEYVKEFAKTVAVTVAVTETKASISSTVLTLGEFGHVQLTEKEIEKLKEKLNGSFDYYVNRYDRWAEDQPAKVKGRKPYPTILNWYDQDVREGKIQPHARSPASQKFSEEELDALELKTFGKIRKAGEK